MILVQKPFYFVRHGQTDWNKEHRAQGQIDIPLNATGLEQARVTAQNLLALPFTSIVASPLQRALQTARIIADVTGKPITIIDELKECSWGIREGECKGDGSWMQQWRNGGIIPAAEPKQDFVQRVARGFNKALQSTDYPLIVAHGGVYWALQEILQLPAGDISNCCIIAYQPPISPVAVWHINEVHNAPDYRF